MAYGIITDAPGVGPVARYDEGDDAATIEASLPAGWSVDWSSQVRLSAAAHDYSAPLVRVEIKRDGWYVSKANDEQCIVKITDEERAQLVILDGGDGSISERDWGHADWPSADEISSAASELYGRPVRVKFFDKGDDLDEAVYNLI